MTRMPDVIEDDWIEDEEELEARLREYTERRSRANASTADMPAT